MTRAFILFGGLFGAAGVALAAAAAHIGGPGLASASQILMVHAPVLLAIGLHGRGGAGAEAWALLIGGLFILVGVALFSGELSLAAYRGQPLFPKAAPTGGMMIIIGWLALALVGVVRRSTAR